MTYDELIEWTLKRAAETWPFVVASDDPPPRHSADDYRAIAERLKQLGYRGWITG